MSHYHNRWIQSSLETEFKKEVLNWKASKLTNSDCIDASVLPPIKFLEPVLTPFSIELLLKLEQQAVQGGKT